MQVFFCLLLLLRLLSSFLLRHHVLLPHGHGANCAHCTPARTSRTHPAAGRPCTTLRRMITQLQRRASRGTGCLIDSCSTTAWLSSTTPSSLLPCASPDPPTFVLLFGRYACLHCGVPAVCGLGSCDPAVCGLGSCDPVVCGLGCCDRLVGECSGHVGRSPLGVGVGWLRRAGGKRGAAAAVPPHACCTSAAVRACRP